MGEKPDAIGTLPNGESIYPEEGLELDSPQAIESYVEEKINEFKKTHVQCRHCDEWISTDDAMTTSDDEYFCKTCYNDHCLPCEDCNEVHYDGDMTKIGGKWFCSDCEDKWVECRDCGEVGRKSDMHGYAGDYVCDSCYEDHYRTCYSCCRVIHEDDVCWHNDNAYCSSCVPEEDLSKVIDYHEFEDDGGKYKPHRLAHDPDDARNRLFLGVELECESGDEDNRLDTDYFQNWFDQGYLIHFEHDGSLNDDGVECISQPCTLKFHQEKMDWKRICEKLRSQGYKSHDTENCGLHVHMSRSALSPLQIVKMDVFINRAQDFWSQIGRRREIYNGSYEKGKTPTVAKGYQGNYCHRSVNNTNNCGDDRYVPVNTTNSNTVEIRIFKGTLCPETILGTLECLDALPKYLDTVSICEIYKTEKLIAGFIKYMGDNYFRYPNAIPMMKRLVKFQWDKMVRKIWDKYNVVNDDKEV